MKQLTALLLLLCLSLCLITGCAQKETIGHTSGLAVFDDSGLTGEKIDPTKTGKMTILNFWGTWCPYCLYEMPHLNDIAEKYKDKLSVVAVHTDIAGTDAIEYVKTYIPDSSIIFANDHQNAFYSTMGGNGSYPYTVILDGEGKVKTRFYGYQDYETWENIVNSMLGK